MIDIQDLRKSFGALRILNGASARIDPGSFTAIRGSSGCGKSTLLLCVGGLLAADAGAVVIDGVDVQRLTARKRDAFRARTLGFVFQRFHLVPYLSVADNIRAAGLASGHDDQQRAQELMDRFGLGARADHEPGRLSVGEQQRCALARALYNRPKVLLADEPTGNLDPDNAAIVLGAFREFAAGGGTVLMVTHHSEAAEAAGTRLRIADGHISPEETP